MITHSTGKLNITFLTTSFPRFEGDFAGIFIYKYAQELARFGHSVKVIAPHDSHVENSPEWCDVEAGYFKYFYPKSFQTLAYGAGMISRIKQNSWRLLLMPFFLTAFFFAALRAGRDSDLIHAYWAPSGCIALLARAFTKVPVVINLWGSDILLFKIPGIAIILKMMLRKADAIICESDIYRGQLEQMGLPRNKISVIPNGIDVETFKPLNKMSARSQLKLSEDKTIILNVGGMSPLKGQKYLIESIPKIIKKYQNVQFIFVGDGEIRNDLEFLVKTRGLAQYVLFAGIQKATQIPLWLNCADIFVLPSLSEGNPNVLLEAMACGLPIVATDVGGIPEMIENDKEGLLGPPKSSASLAQNITTLIRDQALRYQLGQHGFKTVREKYANWKTQSHQLKTIYEELIISKVSNKTQVLTIYYKHKPGGFCKRLKMKINAYLNTGWIVHYISVEHFPYDHPHLIPHILPTPMQKHDTVLFWIYFFLAAPCYMAFIGLQNKVNLISVFSPLYALISCPAKWISKVPMLTFVRFPPHQNPAFSYRESCLVTYVEGLLEKFGLAVSDRVLATSEAVRQAIVNRQQGACKKTKIFYNHIEEAPFDATRQKKRLIREFSLAGNPFIIATSGLLQKRKNQEFLIRAFANTQNSESILIVMGDGDQKENLQQLAEQLGISDRTIFTGWRNDVMQLVQGADLFVFCSSQEGLSNSLLEAVASGVPCLVSNTPENQEVLRNPEQHFPPDQPDILTEKIMRAIKDREYYDNILKSTLEDKKRFIFDWEGEIIREAKELLGRVRRKETLC